MDFLEVSHRLAKKVDFIEQETPEPIALGSPWTISKRSDSFPKVSTER